jgi:hypothetical protein
MALVSSIRRHQARGNIPPGGAILGPLAKRSKVTDDSGIGSISMDTSYSTYAGDVLSSSQLSAGSAKALNNIFGFYGEDAVKSSQLAALAGLSSATQSGAGNVSTSSGAQTDISAASSTGTSIAAQFLSGMQNWGTGASLLTTFQEKMRFAKRNTVVSQLLSN